MFISKIVPAICLAGLPLLVAVHGSSLPSSLPAQCTDYMILDEASRSASQGGCETPSQCFCDKQTNEVAYWISSNSSFIQSLLQFLYKFCRLAFLYCFPYSYRSSNYCDSNSCRSFTLLKALALKVTVIFSLLPLRPRKSDNYRYRDSWKSDNFRERAIKKEAKNWYQKGC